MLKYNKFLNHQTHWQILIHKMSILLNIATKERFYRQEEGPKNGKPRHPRKDTGVKP